MSAYKQISIKDTKEMIATDIYLLDIRDQESFERSHIPNAVHLSNESIDNFLIDADKTKTTIIYCYKGISSLSAAQHFCELGFSDVYSMHGGYEEWISSND